MTVTVRLFAAAAEAAHTEQVDLQVATVGALQAALDLRFGREFKRVREQCSIMVEGEHAGPEVLIPEGAVVDVLPPFAGG